MRRFLQGFFGSKKEDEPVVDFFPHPTRPYTNWIQPLQHFRTVRLADEDNQEITERDHTARAFNLENCRFQCRACWEIVPGTPSSRNFAEGFNLGPNCERCTNFLIDVKTHAMEQAAAYLFTLSKVKSARDQPLPDPDQDTDEAETVLPA